MLDAERKSFANLAKLGVEEMFDSAMNLQINRMVVKTIKNFTCYQIRK